MKDDPDDECNKKIDYKYHKKILILLRNPISIIRISRKLSCEEMSKIFGITKGHMSSYEDGRRNIKEDKLIKGLNKLGIDYNKYLEYQLFLNKLVESSISIEKKWNIGLGRALGLSNTNLEESNNLINVLQKKKMIV